MRVLFLTNIPSPYRVEFFNELSKKCDLTVLFETEYAKSRNSAWGKDLEFHFNGVFLKGRRIGEAEAICPNVIRYLSSKKYDIIIVGIYSSPTGRIAIQFMKLMNIPFIINTDGGMIKHDSTIKYLVKKHFLSAASAWLSTSEETTKYLCYYGAKKNKVYKYPFSSIKEQEILKKPLQREEKSIIRKKLNIKEDTMILSVGQIIYRKGYDILLEASQKINRNVGIYIVGGLETEEYKRIKKALNIENVYFLQFMSKEKLSDYYKAADAFVLPTREDIWGLVINEAMAYGLPTVTTDRCVAGIEMINSGIEGYIVPANNSAQLADYLNLYNEIDSSVVLEKARKYTIEAMAKKHIEIFNVIMEKRKEDIL